MTDSRYHDLTRSIYRITLCSLLFSVASVSHGDIGHPEKIPSIMDIGDCLLKWVNLDYPGLEETKLMLAEGRKEKALRSLLTYFRTSVRPRLLENEPDPVSLADTTVADQIIQNQITARNRTVDLKDWNHIENEDRAWNWEMQRHAWWVDVAQAYFDTGNERYAAYLNGIIMDWFLSNSVPKEDVVTFTKNPLATGWRTLDVGARLMDNWPRVFLYTRSSPSLSDESLVAFLRSWHEQAEHLVAYPKSAKWLLEESSGLLMTAVMFPEFLKAENWREVANSRLEALAPDQILEDGSHIEGSLEYLTPCLVRFAQAYHIQNLNALEAPEIFYQRALLGVYYMIGIVKPSFYLPAINDCDRLNILDLFAEFGENLPPASEVEYIRTKRAEGYTPPSTCFYFPCAGHFVFRDSWESDSLYALFDVGIFGNGFAHEDRLQFELAAFGETLLGDMGRSTHQPGPEGEYFIGPQSHNCILIDGNGMNYRSTSPSAWINRKPLAWPYNLEEGVKWAQARYDGPWQSRKRYRIWRNQTESQPKIKWVRRFTFVIPAGDLPGLWVVSDLIEGAGKHNVTQMLNFYPGQLSIDESKNRIFFRRNGVNLVGQSLSDTPVDITLAEGQQNPFRGWFSPAQGVKEPAPSVWITGESTLPLRRDMVLMPYRIGETSPLLSASF